MNSFGAIAAVPLIFRSLACARFSECRYAAKTRSGENNLDASDLGMEVAVEKKMPYLRSLHITIQEPGTGYFSPNSGCK